jgi:23S rRNA (cytidine1920-2'-O)/16S rRNA (cytidine1409-2'-O)-methyltransferase
VLDKKAIERAMQKFEDAAALKGWRLLRKSPAQLSGKEGNQEWCYYFEK